MKWKLNQDVPFKPIRGGRVHALKKDFLPGGHKVNETLFSHFIRRLGHYYLVPRILHYS